MEKKLTGLAHFIAAMGYSYQGLKTTWRTETAFRQEAIMALIMLPTSLWLGATAMQRAILILVVLLVLVVELINTAVEAAVDRSGTEQHVLSGKAKDAGSAAVFISLGAMMTVWTLIIFERFSVHLFN